MRDSGAVRGLKSSQFYKTTRHQSLIDYMLQKKKDYMLQSGSVNKDSKKEGFTMAWQISGADSLRGVFPGGRVVKNPDAG